MNNETIQFLLTTLMELGTLLTVFLALRQFRDTKWLRFWLIVGPLLVNAALYLIYRTTPFFYLGVVLVLCLPFVWPRRSA